MIPCSGLRNARSCWHGTITPNHSLRGTHARSLQEARIAQQACFKLPALPDAYRGDDSPETSWVGAHFRV